MDCEVQEHLFDRKVLDVVNLMGVSLGKFSVCVGHRKARRTFGQIAALE